MKSPVDTAALRALVEKDSAASHSSNSHLTNITKEFLQ
jgi:hypothetical protein